VPRFAGISKCRASFVAKGSRFRRRSGVAARLGVEDAPAGAQSAVVQKVGDNFAAGTTFTADDQRQVVRRQSIPMVSRMA